MKMNIIVYAFFSFNRWKQNMYKKIVEEWKNEEGDTFSSHSSYSVVQQIDDDYEISKSDFDEKFIYVPSIDYQINLDRNNILIVG